VDEVIEKANDRIAWCGRWTREGDKITAVCTECGCPLVRNGLVSLAGTLCYCSLGWVRAIFEALLRKPVKVELEKAIGFGDEICEFVVSI
jgi:predicted hydrocarbon binding protein